ncbi:MAG TPA: RDD family protein [Allosphingosinicella sp.]
MSDKQLETESTGHRPPASLLSRLFAYAADILLLFAFVVASQGLLLLSGLHPYQDAFGGGAQPAPADLHLWVLASTTLPFAAYFAISFASRRGATLGQRQFGLRVADRNGERLGGGGAVLRALVLLLPFEVNHAVMFHAAPWRGTSEAIFLAGLALVWLLSSLFVALPLLRRDRRSLHDLACGSAVLVARQRR